MNSWRLFLFCLFFSFSSFLHASVTKFELPANHALQKPLNKLFKEPDLLLESREDLKEAGFEVFEHHHRGLVVARHPELKGYLIKVLINDDSHESQIENYVRRIEGATRLQKFISENGLQHIVTPKKWLYPLKENDLGISYVLLVEEMPIVSKAESTERYAKIDPAVLTELCIVLKKFRGLDSIVKNMPFTEDGKIAFIDTERWQTVRPALLRHIRSLLDPRARKIVDSYRDQDPYWEWLLPENHPLQEILPTYFTASSLFDGPEDLLENGFEVNKRIHQKMMVFTHPDIPGYIFKRFQNSVPYFDQVEKYMIRLKGAEKVRAVIAENSLSHIVVPQKWLYRLPYSDDEYLVIAEKFDICPGDDAKDGENVQRYRTMSLDVLRELCIAMKALGGCDAWPRNQPFTRDGKIAFIDTEHVGHKEWHFEKYIMPLLNKEQRAFAKQVLEK